jgi:hypothetical protein
MPVLTKAETDALRNWVSFNQYLKDAKKIPVERLEEMLEHEVENKKRINIISRLNNKIFERKRSDNFERIMKKRVAK